MKAPDRPTAETSRERRRRETRAALLESAYETFCEVGYNAASLEAIAAAAGFTRGAIYANFNNKEDLFLELDAQHAETMAAEWRAIASEGNGAVNPPALGAWLADVIKRRFGWFLASAEFSLAAVRDPVLIARRLNTVRRVHRELGEALIRSGAVEETPEDLGRIASAFIDGVVFNARLDPDLDVAALITTGFRRLMAS